MAEPGLEDGVNRVPAERLAQPEPSGHGALEHDAERTRDHEPEGQAREDPEQPRAELRGRRAKDDRERDRAADDEQDQREVERAHELEERVDRARASWRRRPACTSSAFAFLTLKTNAPATGCESAEITRHVTV